jgi:dienelactone hydrolase
MMWAIPLLVPALLSLLASQAGADRAGDIVQIARTTVERLAEGRYDAVVATFDEKMRAALPADKLRATWASVQTQTGAFRRVRDPRVETKGDFVLVVFPAEFANANAEIQLVFNPARRIAGFSVRPPTPDAAFSDAAYVVPGSFAERDATVDAGGWPLPGTLSVPARSGPSPAVVLVHGSGPVDRDATIGPNKVFRDLAHGLASRGVTVLRYEKRTREHGRRVAPLRQFTVKEETIDDAVAAVRLLRGTPGIDPDRVYVLGHSLGGMLAPRIAVAAGTLVRGLIVLAGAVRPLEQSLADQTRYLAMADGTISVDEQRQLDELAALIERVKTMKATDAPVQMIGAAAPASYLVDLRGYDPPAAARALDLPMLVLQGERDYQVTTDDFSKWKAALGTRANVTFQAYPALNHLFMSGEGRSLPGEYSVPGHVDEEVIRDIAAWVGKGGA